MLVQWISVHQVWRGIGLLRPVIGNDMWSALESLFLNLMDRHFPFKRKRMRKKTNPWFNKEALRVMRARDSAHKTAMNSKLPSCWDSSKRLWDQGTSEKNLLLKKSPKNASKVTALWNIRKILPGKEKVRDIQHIVIIGKEVCDPEAIAESQ